MHIDIDIPRPWLTLALVAGVIAIPIWASGATTTPVTTVASNVASSVQTAAHDIVADAGGDDTPPQKKIFEIESNLRDGRAQLEILNHREEILDYQLKVLQDESAALGSTVDPATEDQIRQSTEILMALKKDKRKAEEFLLESFNQIWLANGEPTATGKGLINTSDSFNGFAYWPVDPSRGISAGFHDPTYPFPFLHEAIDIRAPQNSDLVAAADGTVSEVKDDVGLGFAYLIIDHGDGYRTLYGHISKSLVAVGDHVRAGQIIAKSGGMPGTRGAGAFTTGSHLHFELRINGVPTDPTPFLPKAGKN